MSKPIIRKVAEKLIMPILPSSKEQKCFKVNLCQTKPFESERLDWLRQLLIFPNWQKFFLITKPRDSLPILIIQNGSLRQIQTVTWRRL